MTLKFATVAAQKGNPKWSQCIKRIDNLYTRENDPRSEFARDYNRILHCNAYSRLKHKTQVFFAADNDHICTRVEHVNHVLSISQTIANWLGLNVELTSAIAIGHDLGHAPFGHEGGDILNGIAKDAIDESFWHEKNSLWFVDNLETIADPQNKQRNLALTYAVRDGIISHCGEVDEPGIFPRNDAGELNQINAPNQLQPYTWEGCVVKIADKIAYLGRDIEDAITLGIISRQEFNDKSTHLIKFMQSSEEIKQDEITNTALIHVFITDLCKTSNLDLGLKFSNDRFELMKELRSLNNTLIYQHPRLQYFKKLARLILESIYKILSTCYQGLETPKSIHATLQPYPLLKDNFYDWIIKYTDVNKTARTEAGYENKTVYDIKQKGDYHRAIIDFISGMTDSFALKIFEELTRFM